MFAYNPNDYAQNAYGNSIKRSQGLGSLMEMFRGGSNMARPAVMPRREFGVMQPSVDNTEAIGPTAATPATPDPNQGQPTQPYEDAMRRARAVQHQQIPQHQIYQPRMNPFGMGLGMANPYGMNPYTSFGRPPMMGGFGYGGMSPYGGM